MALLSRLRPTGLRLILLAIPLLRVSAEVTVADEYQVKAVFLLNFTKFVEWPAQMFKSDNDPVAICVLGENPFGSTLKEAVRGKMVGNRTLTVRQIAAAKDAAGCHILFLAIADGNRARAALAELSGRGVLTVGEADDFITAGGIVRFMLKDERVRLEINAGAAEKVSLKISSKLLSIAETVRK